MNGGVRASRAVAASVIVAVSFAPISPVKADTTDDKIESLRAKIDELQRELTEIRNATDSSSKQGRASTAQPEGNGLNSNPPTAVAMATDRAVVEPVTRDPSLRPVPPAERARYSFLVGCPDAENFYGNEHNPVVISAAPPMLRKRDDPSKGFKIPGTDTCLRFGGRVRTDTTAMNSFNTAQNNFNFRTRGYLGFQAVTPTRWGPLRLNFDTLIEMDTQRGTQVTLDTANIQYGGFTVGVLEHSLYDMFNTNYLGYTGGNQNGRGSDLQPTTALAYTHQFGKLTATLALEDSVPRRSGVGTFNNKASPLTFGNTTLNFAGENQPDFLTRWQWTDSWGTVLLSSALHKTGAVATSTTGNPFGNNSTQGDNVLGYALQAGGRFRLTARNYFTLQASIARAANSYTGWTTVNSGAVTMPVADVIYDANGGVHPTRSWSGVVSFEHIWNAEWREAVYASYGLLNQYGPNYDARIASFGHVLSFTPAYKFTIGLELFYGRFTQMPVAYTQLSGSSAPKSGVFTARLRLQRDF